MTNQNQTMDLLKQLKENPPKVIGGYKRQGWAVKILDSMSNDSVEQEEDRIVTAKAVIEANDKTYYPAFLTLDLNKNGQIIGAYFVTEDDEHYNLIPFEIIKDYINKTEAELLPFKYRTLEKIDGDGIQVNWPEFT
ncbi:hypothetical protein SM124_09170 [Bacillus sp. 31A1R]|uniref:Uncharacterized protein n=1 Tax=Robertmurraya mangrovi TaxID=3098077 RepID=A0ABU5IXN8_9BACI|nr:hypothetical protein [Bacillus sp. 31A1R]MDZ5471917.1 hypothetical protein [Bacillus sp. 31A1R]